MKVPWFIAAAFAAAFGANGAQAKPIAFANGTTTMVEHGAGTMAEAQLFYAPRYWFSVGAGYLALGSDIDDFDRRISYVRANLLAKRWNLPAAQANVFAWGGLGSATGTGFGRETAVNAGAQIDYETRRIYGSLRTDWHRGDSFAHRIDTVQLGVAPYAHDYDSLATWFVLQGRQYSNRLYDGVEWALLLRLFKGGTWVEAGVTQDGHPQVMMMFNF
ncbi:MAG TPA: hypothetical protein VND91_02520 [Candidatus Saccharimonadia bacterium]|nr:hypothetical protein [Candidatus Saccharimonadia bacterium]